MTTCRLCDHTLTETWSAKDAKSGATLTMTLCNNCGLVQQSNLPSDEELKIYYSHHYREDYKSTHQPALKYVRRAGETAMSRLAFMERSGITAAGKRLLDIGAGGGEFCYLAGRRGFATQGIEPHHGYSQFARAEYDVEVQTCGIADLQSHEADVVTLFHVFEHLAHPTAVIRKVWSVLSDGGYWVVEVPNIHQADASPHNIYFKAHLFYYSRHSLMCAASPYFELVRVEDHGNLIMALRKRADPLPHMSLPCQAQIHQTRLRLSRKGWTEYLLKGGGWMKPLKRIAKILEESSLGQQSPRAVLDSVESSKPTRRPLWIAIGLSVGIVLAAETCT